MVSVRGSKQNPMLQHRGRDPPREFPESYIYRDMVSPSLSRSHTSSTKSSEEIQTHQLQTFVGDTALITTQFEQAFTTFIIMDTYVDKVNYGEFLNDSCWADVDLSPEAPHHGEAAVKPAKDMPDFATAEIGQLRSFYSEAYLTAIVSNQA